MSTISVYNSQDKENSFLSNSKTDLRELKFSTILLINTWSLSKSVSSCSIREADTFLATLKG